MNFTLDDDADATLSNFYDATGLLPVLTPWKSWLRLVGTDRSDLSTEGGVADQANSEATIDSPAGGYVEWHFYTNTKLVRSPSSKMLFPTGAQGVRLHHHWNRSQRLQPGWQALNPATK